MTVPILFDDQLKILLLSMVPGLPLVVGLSLFIKPLQEFLLRVAPWTALPALAVALFLKPGITLKVPWFFMGGRMGLDPVGQNFLLLAALVWMLSAFFGRSYLRNDSRRCYFFFFYLLSMAFNFGLILAQEMLGFYLFFGLMSISAYGLIIHTKSDEALLAGKVYIVLVMAGEGLLIAGMLLLASRLPDWELSTIAASQPDNLSLTLLFLGFAIKVGALPVHIWLPLAHPVAPVPASAVLSGVMIKAGLLGWIRFLPVGQEVILSGWGALFVVLGILAAFYGVLIGLTQREAKSILAYSSISQMGLMTMLVGCGLLSPAFWPQVTNAISIYALNHGLAKAALFLGTGLVREGNWQKPPPWLLVLLLFPALALAGLPLTSGAIAKFTIKEILEGLPSQWGVPLKRILPLTALATMLLLGHFLRVISQSIVTPKPMLPAGMLIPWVTLLVGVGGLLWVWPVYPEYAEHITDGNLFWQNLYPVVLGFGILFSCWKWCAGKNMPRLPAGDILWLFYGPSKKEPGWIYKKFFSRDAAIMKSSGQGEMNQVLCNTGRKVEKKFMRWGVVGSCYILLFFTFLCLLFMQ
nr:NADH dehydrogenase [Desulfobulbaceae bacterium]